MQRSTWQRIEYGESAVSMDLIWRVADVLEVPMTWLVSDEWGWPLGGGARGGEYPDGSPPVRYP